MAADAARAPLSLPPATGGRLRLRWRWLALGPRIWLGLALIALILATAIVVPLVEHASPDALNPVAALLPPSWAHPFGTDEYGRDIFLRAAYAARLDLLFGLVPVLVSFLLGGTLGLVAGYLGSWTEIVIMRLVDVMLAFPYLVLVIVILAILGGGIEGMMIAIVLVDWTVYARLVRSEVLVVRRLDYITAGRLLGFPKWRIMVRHVLPNVVTPALVYSMVDVVNTILVAASLSYLGLGVQPPTPEWGAMIADGQNFLFQAWWMTVMPGIMLVFTGVGLSLVADGVAEMVEGG
jgi:peptide/nickel transport system permease protein